MGHWLLPHTNVMRKVDHQFQWEIFSLEASLSSRWQARWRSRGSGLPLNTAAACTENTHRLHLAALQQLHQPRGSQPATHFLTLRRLQRGHARCLPDCAAAVSCPPCT